MIKKIEVPSIIKAAGNKPKRIEEYIGRVNSGSEEISIARMVSPQGWTEPRQKPAFDEYTLVLRGALSLSFGDGSEMVVRANTSG